MTVSEGHTPARLERGSPVNGLFSLTFIQYLIFDQCSEAPGSTGMFVFLTFVELSHVVHYCIQLMQNIQPKHTSIITYSNGMKFIVYYLMGPGGCKHTVQ